VDPPSPAATGIGAKTGPPSSQTARCTQAACAPRAVQYHSDASSWWQL